MAYGKGTWSGQNKKLPGTYINFTGEEQVSDIFGDRGKAAMAMTFDWGEDTSDIFVLTPSQFNSKCKQMFGYDYNSPQLQPIREVFLGGATELYLYRLNATGGTAATCEIATARYKGVRGNDLSIVVTANVDVPSKYDVVTTLDGVSVDKQIAVDTDTLEDNDFVIFNDPVESLTAKTYTFSTGANAVGEVTAAMHTDFLTKLSGYNVNCVGCIYATASETPLSTLYANWVIEQRDVYANPIQAVVYNSPSDHEAVINVDESLNFVPWFLGAEAGCALNTTIQNKTYNGNYVPTKNYTQAELEQTLDEGKIVLHRVGQEYRVLADINSLVTTGTNGKNDEFKENKTIRVIDDIATNICDIFNNGYIGKVTNNEAGRLSFQNQIIVLLDSYVDASVIGPYEKSEVTCVEGEQRGSVVVSLAVTLTHMVEKAYVTVVVG